MSGRLRAIVVALAMLAMLATAMLPPGGAAAANSRVVAAGHAPAVAGEQTARPHHP